MSSDSRQTCITFTPATWCSARSPARLARLRPDLIADDSSQFAVDLARSGLLHRLSDRADATLVVVGMEPADLPFTFRLELIEGGANTLAAVDVHDISGL